MTNTVGTAVCQRFITHPYDLFFTRCFLASLSRHLLLPGVTYARLRVYAPSIRPHRAVCVSPQAEVMVEGETPTTAEGVDGERRGGPASTVYTHENIASLARA